MISSAATSTVLKLTQVCGRQIWIEQLPSTTGILTALQFLCLYSAYLHSVLFKKQRHRIDGKDSCSFCLSLSTTPFPLSFLPKAFTALQSPPVLCSSHWHPPPPPSLGSPSLGCQMYYRVKRSNVNTESCHGCRVVWPSPSPPSISLWPRGGGFQRKRVSGGGERSSWSVICVLARTAVFLQSAASVNASYLWAKMVRSSAYI